MENQKLTKSEVNIWSTNKEYHTTIRWEKGNIHLPGGGGPLKNVNGTKFGGGPLGAPGGIGCLGGIIIGGGGQFKLKKLLLFTISSGGWVKAKVVKHTK